MAWPLLADVCATLRPGATAGASGVPILLTASGCGAQLAALVRSKLQALSAEAASDEGAAAESWAALACLPHAAENAAQAAACCAALAAATAPADDDMEQGSSSALLMLHCGALGAQAALLTASGQEGNGQATAALLPQALALLVRHPGNYHAVAAAAEVLQAAAAGGAELSTQQLQELVPLLAPNLSAASQPLRRETLRVLCCFRMPPMLPPAGSEDASRDAAPQPGDALQQLLALESRQQGTDGGRPAVVALGRMRNYLEYRRLPDWLVPAVAHELLGVLHIRWAGGTQGCWALGAAGVGRLRGGVGLRPSSPPRQPCLGDTSRHHIPAPPLTHGLPASLPDSPSGLRGCGTQRTMRWPWLWTSIPPWPGP